MAAPPSKQSPSSQKMHQSDSACANNHRKDPPPASSTAAMVSAVTVTDIAQKDSATLTYQASETSESYLVAKQLLNSDNFEGALNVIEEALRKTTIEIRASFGLADANDNTNTDLETEIQMHEALGPLHYLYGTTLLYSLEETTENDSNAVAMVMPTVATPDSDNTRVQLNALAADEDSHSNAVADLEDIHIAWENLEAARAIVEKMLKHASSDSSNNALSEHVVAKLQLDLAQIHLREGDLQRINGNYTSAVGDYSICLKTLLQHDHTRDEENNIRNLGRKIADTQYNLGLTYLTSSSDLQKQIADAEIGNSDASMSPKEKDEATQHRRKAVVLAKEHCQKGIQQYFDCARTFCNIIANRLGIDSETILLSAKSTSNGMIEDSRKPPAGLKTTGLDDESSAHTTATSTKTDVSKTLNAWRKIVAKLVESFGERENALALLDIVQVLNEIQEIIDEAERSQEAVFQAATIRVKAQQAAAALEDEGAAGAAVANPDGSTTTIGFGPVASFVAASETVNVSAKPQPMMVVKKKKKRRHSGSGSYDDEREPKKVSHDSDANE